ncbi:MAG: DUF484 family protein [Pseudomonadaceae bacterium]|nr:DUF484 family protein [Pseudomonadaceae bacterium]
MSSATLTPTTATSATETINAEQVAAWLSENNNFFIGRDSLLASLELEHACGNSESLLLYQIKILRQELSQNKLNHEQLLNNARENERRLKRIERLLVKLLEAESTEELVLLLKEELQQHFALPHLIIWSHSNLHSLPKASQAQQQQQLALLAKKSSASLQLNAITAHLLGLGDLEQGSAIICRLNHTHHLGLLVIAHPSSNHFRQQDTLFVEYLGTIVSSLIHRHQAEVQ